MTHPNVMNGAMLSWPQAGIQYVEGYALDEFCAGRYVVSSCGDLRMMGKYGLHVPREPVTCVVLTFAGSDEATSHGIEHAARTSHRTNETTSLQNVEDERPLSSALTTLEGSMFVVSLELPSPLSGKLCVTKCHRVCSCGMRP